MTRCRPSIVVASVIPAASDRPSPPRSPSPARGLRPPARAVPLVLAGWPMRVCDRLSAVVVALAFMLAGLGAPACAETRRPGAVVTAAHRSAVHDAPHIHPPDVRPVAAPVTTSHLPAAPSGDRRVVGERPAHLGTPPAPRVRGVGGPCGDHRAGVGQTDGPDDLLLGGARAGRRHARPAPRRGPLPAAGGSAVAPGHPAHPGATRHRLTSSSPAVPGRTRMWRTPRCGRPLATRVECGRCSSARRRPWPRHPPPWVPLPGPPCPGTP